MDVMVKHSISLPIHVIYYRLLPLVITTCVVLFL